MVVTYYIKLFEKRADKRNDILMSLLLLVAETTKVKKKRYFADTWEALLIRKRELDN